MSLYLFFNRQLGKKEKSVVFAAACYVTAEDEKEEGGGCERAKERNGDGEAGPPRPTFA